MHRYLIGKQCRLIHKVHELVLGRNNGFNTSQTKTQWLLLRKSNLYVMKKKLEI